MGYVPVKGDDYTASVENYTLTSVVIAPKEDVPQPSDKLTLSASAKEIRKASGTKDVYFYAQTDPDVTSVSLYDSDSAVLAATMLDDGNYSVSGDDMQGDGVYSCKLALDISEKKDYSFVAKTADGGEEIISNTLVIVVYDDFSDDQKACMTEVKDAVNALQQNDAFKALSVDEQIAQTRALLEELSENGTENKPFSLIKQGSVNFSSASKIFTFKYPSGVIGMISLESKDILDHRYALGSLDGNNIPETNVALTGPIAANIPADSVKGTVLFSLDPEGWPISQYDGYLDVLRNAGADIDFDTDVTITDFKTKLSDNDFVYFLMHGGYIFLPDIGDTSVLISEEDVTDFDTYSYDLLQERIAILQNTSTGEYIYAVLPKLFSDCYAGGKLDDTVVGLCSCEVFGAGDVYDDTMAQSFISSGASCALGFHDSVLCAYSDSMLISFFNIMLNGYTAGEALEACIDAFGENDLIFAENNGIPTIYALGAYPVLIGDQNARINAHSLVNGDYEKVIDPTSVIDTIIKGWNKGGDTRVLTQLGPISPVSGSHMAILTTGVGSGENIYISGGTEGSSLSDIPHTRRRSDCKLYLQCSFRGAYGVGRFTV